MKLERRGMYTALVLFISVITGPFIADRESLGPVVANLRDNYSLMIVLAGIAIFCTIILINGQNREQMGKAGIYVSVAMAVLCAGGAGYLAYFGSAGLNAVLYPRCAQC